MIGQTQGVPDPCRNRKKDFEAMLYMLDYLEAELEFYSLSNIAEHLRDAKNLLMQANRR